MSDYLPTTPATRVDMRDDGVHFIEPDGSEKIEPYPALLFAEQWPEADRRIKQLENMVVRLYVDSRIYLGVCMDAKCGAPDHPHWVSQPRVDWSRPIIYPEISGQ